MDDELYMTDFAVEGINSDSKFLTFQIGSEDYAFYIQYITEIIGIQKITELPNVPKYIRGLINLRGKVIPIIDVRLRFDKQEREYDERTCIIVTHLNDVHIGLIVDRVSEVLNIPAKDIDLPPTISKGSESRFISGLGKIDGNVKIIVNLERLLYDIEIDKITKQINE